MGKTIISLLFTLLVLSPFSSNGQTKGKTIIITNTYDYFDVDPLGNIYAIEGNKLVKMNINGDTLAQYSHQSLGNITSISVVNSMKAFLFYQESGSLVFLDEHLAPLGAPIHLFEKNYTQISLASYSTQNQIRLFDPFANEIIILDFYGNEISRTNFTFSLQTPIKIIELGQNQFAIQDGQQGVFLFDNFGTYSKQVALVTTQPLFLDRNVFYYNENNKMRGYDYVKLSNMETELNADHVKMAQFYHGTTIILKNQ